MRRVLRNSFETILRIAKSFYWRLINGAYRFGFLSLYDIPVVINNFNRLTYPLKLISFLEKCGFRNIIILDNNSTYPPLLGYYKTCKHKVVMERHNYGHLALWKSGLYDSCKWNYFVYTDSDVVPVEECPTDFIHYFKSLLDTRYTLDKVGFGIRIDDLPESFTLKEKVTAYEKKYWMKEVTSGVYDAPIDTTFALYKPFSSLRANEIYTLSAVRLGFPYVIRHLPWYVDSQNLSAEERFYMQSCNSSSSLGQQQNGRRDVY